MPKMPDSILAETPERKQKWIEGGCLLVGDRTEGLVRIADPVPGYDIWLLTHPDLRKTGRIRALLDFLAEAFKVHRPLLEGRRGETIPPVRKQPAA